MGLAPGATLGPYRIIEPLGKGGMATVYKAYEAGLDRYVALKVLPAEFLHDETFAERFRREARVIARLEHPNIVPIHGFGIEGGTPWMAMRLVSGGTLAGLLQGGRLAPAHVLLILQGVAAALEYAHGKGVIHRDVKPQNVLLDEDRRVYLADFGIARMVAGSGTLTATGMITGTPHYMAPEQALGRPVDHRADIYALGIMAYQMLIGQVPFEADTPVAVLLKHASEPMPLPSPADLAEPASRALLKCLAKPPEDRWPTAPAFVQALASGLGEAAPEGAVPFATATISLPVTAPAGVSRTASVPVTAAPTAVAARPTAPPRRAARGRAALAAAGGVIVLGALAFLGIGYLGISRAPQETPSAPARGAGPVAPTPEPAPAMSAPPATPVPVVARAGGAAPARPPATASERETETERAAEATPEPEDDAADGLSAPDTPARLAIDFEHPLKVGTLRVWLDDELLLTQTLDADSTKSVVGLKLRKGGIDYAVEVPPGEHTVRVEVAWDDNRKSEAITAAFPAGGVRRLEARLGRIRKNLSLDWN
jgi:serine/threonine-protein kinase